MRIAIFAAAIFLAGLSAAAAATPAANPAPVAATKSVSATKLPPAVASSLRTFDRSYRAHRDNFVAVSKYSEATRRNRLLALAGILLFAFLTLPRNARGVRAFYRQMIASSPLPDFPDGSIDPVNVQQARAVLFFYLLFLLYQIVAFPLTLGRDNIIQFSADLFFQSAILIALIWSFHVLKRDLRAQWRDDPARREKMDLWLNEKLEGMNIRWRDISKLALGVFAVGFAPVTLAHLPDWLDAFTALADRISGA
ncbi:MAG: hypothetical protein ABSC92_17785 [Rhizomicrobium sp.]|jgi:hypothetical protein